MHGCFLLITHCGERLECIVATSPGKVFYVVRVGHLDVAVAHIEWDAGNKRWWFGVDVTERFQRKGIGTALTRAVLADFSDILWLTCPAHLVGWYRGMGFNVCVDETIKKAEGQVLMMREPA